MLKNCILFLLAFLFLAPEVRGEDPVEARLRELDAELARKAEYDARKEDRLERLKISLRSAQDDAERYASTKALFEEYKSYKYDSAFSYAARMGELAARLDRPGYRVEAGCAVSFLPE